MKQEAQISQPGTRLQVRDFRIQKPIFNYTIICDLSLCKVVFYFLSAQHLSLKSCTHLAGWSPSGYGDGRLTKAPRHVQATWLKLANQSTVPLRNSSWLMIGHVTETGLTTTFLFKGWKGWRKKGDEWQGGNLRGRRNGLIQWEREVFFFRVTFPIACRDPKNKVNMGSLPRGTQRDRILMIPLEPLNSTFLKFNHPCISS